MKLAFYPFNSKAAHIDHRWHRMTECPFIQVNKKSYKKKKSKQKVPILFLLLFFFFPKKKKKKKTKIYLFFVVIRNHQIYNVPHYSLSRLSKPSLTLLFWSFSWLPINFSLPLSLFHFLSFFSFYLLYSYSLTI